MAHNSDTDKSNVIYLDKKRDKPNLLDVVGELIADYAQDTEPNDHGRGQQVVGDGNLQISSDPVVSQHITGNCNIQISSSDPGLERRLSFLEDYLKKKPTCT